MQPFKCTYSYSFNTANRSQPPRWERRERTVTIFANTEEGARRKCRGYEGAEPFKIVALWGKK